MNPDLEHLKSKPTHFLVAVLKRFDVKGSVHVMNNLLILKDTNLNGMISPYILQI